MAYTDLTRKGTFAQKRAASYFVAHVVETEDTDLATAGNYLIAHLPADALITDVYVNVKTASNATTPTVKLGTAENGGQIMAATSIGTIGVVGALVGEVDTGSGADLYLTVAGTGGTKVGDYVIVIEYLEYDKATGEYTRIS